MGCRNTVMCICPCCLMLVFVTPFFVHITLSYVGTEPKFYIQNLYVPALNISTNNASYRNNSIFIDLKFKRVVAWVPLLYEDLNITLFYASNRSFPVGGLIVRGFYQGTKRTVHRRAVVEAIGLLPIPRGGSTVALAVELATKYKLKRQGGGDSIYEKPKTVVVAANVSFDASGNKASKKPVRLH